MRALDFQLCSYQPLTKNQKLNGSFKIPSRTRMYLTELSPAKLHEIQ